jgi:hypothetical protein
MLVNITHVHRRHGLVVTEHGPLAGPVLIRRSSPHDLPALERLAALESRELPGGSFLVAEIRGEVVAAAPVEVDADPLADPFLPLADIREWLARQAERSRRGRSVRSAA